MTGAAVHQDEHGQTGHHGEHYQRTSAGAPGERTGALTLFARDQVDGPHRGASSTARPAATASLSAETVPTESPSSRPTVCGMSGTCISHWSASEKPLICRAGPLKTTLDTSPPPSCERWKSSELRTSPAISRMPAART